PGCASRAHPRETRGARGARCLARSRRQDCGKVISAEAGGRTPLIGLSRCVILHVIIRDRPTSPADIVIAYRAGARRSLASTPPIPVAAPHLREMYRPVR